MHSVSPDRRRGVLLAVVGAVIWAGTSPGIAYVLSAFGISALALAFWRDACIALFCLALFGLARPALLRVSRRDLAHYAPVGAISIGLYHALWVSSIQVNGAAVAIVLAYTFPGFVALGSRLLFGERMDVVQYVALLLALVGCVLLVRAYDQAALRFSWAGALIGLGTAVTHAGYVLFSQRAVQSASAWTSLTYTMLFGSLLLLAVNLLVAPARLLVFGTQPLPWLAVAVLALGPTLGGYALFTMSLRHIPGPVASLLAVVEAPIAAVASVLLLQERLAWPQVAGIVLVLASAALAQAPLVGPGRARAALSS